MPEFALSSSCPWGYLHLEFSLCCGTGLIIQGTTSPENSSLVSPRNLAKGPGGPSMIGGLILPDAGRWLFDNTHMSASLGLPQLKKKKIFARGNRHYTSRTGQGQGRKVPFSLPNTSQLCRITLSLEIPWNRPDAQLLPLSHLLPPLSHK